MIWQVQIPVHSYKTILPGHPNKQDLICRCSQDGKNKLRGVRGADWRKASRQYSRQRFSNLAWSSRRTGPSAPRHGRALSRGQREIKHRAGVLRLCLCVASTYWEFVRPLVGLMWCDGFGRQAICLFLTFYVSLLHGKRKKSSLELWFLGL